MKLIYTAVLLQVFLLSCSDKSKKSKNKIEEKGVDLKSISRSRIPMMGDRTTIKIPEQFKNLKIKFPPTICGRITKRLMECETERVKKKYVGREAYAKSKATYIKIKFSGKLQKFLKVCRSVAEKIETSKLDKCLTFECEKMDLCMKKLTKKK